MENTQLATRNASQAKINPDNKHEIREERKASHQQDSHLLCEFVAFANILIYTPPSVPNNFTPFSLIWVLRHLIENGLKKFMTYDSYFYILIL